MPGRDIFMTIAGAKRKFAILVVITVIITTLTSAMIFARYDEMKPLKGKVIIIDPGHGGIDGGTNDGRSFLEKDVNLQISLKLRAELEAKGAVVEMTRETDISLDDRNNLSKYRHVRDLLARVACFNSGKYDIFISVHVNRSSSSKAKGPAVLYSPKHSRSLLLAQCMQDKLNIHSKNALKKENGYAPVKSNFFILVNSRIPGVILETGFISNPSEKKLLKDKAYQEKLVRAVSSGVAAYFEELGRETEG